jgi:exosortase/archaeosortase family protein
MKRISPAKIKICAASTRFNRYKEAPIHRSMMLGQKKLEAKNLSPRKIVPYVAVAVIIISIVYYLPNYFFLEKATADHTAFLLNSLGMSVQTMVISGKVYLDEIKVVKDCTGVQVIAVFFGMLISIPNAPLKKKLLTIVTISSVLYVANVLRIVLEFSLVYLKILPWSMAHYPLSLLLGIMGVLILVFIADYLLPEFGDFLFNTARPRAT